MAKEKLLAEWFWADRWSGSSAFGLPQEARGVYREMLTQAWRRGARLPNDHEQIRRLTGTTKAEWRRAWPQIERYWTVDGECLINDTQVLVYADAKARQARAQARAQACAQAMHKQRSSSAQAPLEQCSPSPSPSPSLRKAEEKAVAQTPHRLQPKEEPDANLSIITKIAHEAIDISGAKAEKSDVDEAVKSLCAIRRVDYDSTVVAKAVDSALAQRRRIACEA